MQWDPALEPRIRKYARSVARQAHIRQDDWEDCEQTALLAVLKNWERATSGRDDVKKAVPYLMRCAYNAIMDLARRNRRWQVDKELPLYPGASVDHCAPERMLAEAGISEFLATLDGDEYGAVYKRFTGQAYVKVPDSLREWAEEWFRSEQTQTVVNG